MMTFGDDGGAHIAVDLLAGGGSAYIKGVRITQGSPVCFSAGAKEGSHTFKGAIYTAVAAVALLPQETPYTRGGNGGPRPAVRGATLQRLATAFPKEGLLEEKRDKMGRPFFTAESSVLFVLAHPALAQVGTTAGLVYYWAHGADRAPPPFTTDLREDQQAYWKQSSQGFEPLAQFGATFVTSALLSGAEHFAFDVHV